MAKSIAEQVDPSTSQSRRYAAWLHAFLTLLCVLPIVAAKFPPIYDYYHWLYQGHVFAQLLPWGPTSSAPVENLYSIDWVPVPNMASLFGIGLLDGWMSTATAARLFLAVCAIVFAHGFATLARAVQQRPTVVEFGGYVWAYGYLTYKGYLSNLLALGVAFFAIGIVHMAFRRQRPDGRLAGALALLGVVAYLCHFFGWLVFAAGVGVHVGASLMRRRWRAASYVSLALLPSIALLAWYALATMGDSKIRLYSRVSDKVISLLEPLVVFMRTDPFPEPFPVLWANLFVCAVLLAIWVVARKPSGAVSRLTDPMFVLGVSLTALAIVSPAHWFLGLLRPDERVLLAGLLILSASLPMRSLKRGTGLAAAGVVCLVLLLHTFEYRTATGHFREIARDSKALLPARGSVLTVTVWKTRFDWGLPGWGPSFGTASTKWFDQYRLVDTGQLTGDLMESSLVRARWPGGRSTAHHEDTVPYDRAHDHMGLRANAKRYDITQVIAGPESIDAVAVLLVHSHELIHRTNWLGIFRKKPKRAPQVDIRRIPAAPG